MRFGLHAGPQDCSIGDLRRLWRIADTRGFHWCSVWDHLYSVSDLSDPGKPAFEGIATMAALAASTESVRVEETAIVLRRLFDGERVSFDGRQVRVADAVCSPAPVQKRLRLWIGGQGEKRMLRIVARHADGWNVPFLPPEIYAQRNATLNAWCEKERRDPRAIVRTVNVGLAIGATDARARQQEDRLQLMFGGLTEWVKPGHLLGTPAQARDRLGEYAHAGAEWVILALRAPFDWDGLELFIADVMPEFADRRPA
jgi:alkanesulfonate monooxygenase SsuD/methylene tetrahydromethanopterin reductase-like flavin-dependent oxidoreductase (luciferase family)